MPKAKKVVEPIGELEGKLVLVKKQYLKKEFHDKKHRYFLCQSGFGCSPDLRGGKIFGFYLNDGEDTGIRREYVEEVIPITEDFQKRIDEVKAFIRYRETHCCVCKEEITEGMKSFNILTKQITCQKCSKANESAGSAAL